MSEVFSTVSRKCLGRRGRYAPYGTCGLGRAFTVPRLRPAADGLSDVGESRRIHGMSSELNHRTSLGSSLTCASSGSPDGRFRHNTQWGLSRGVGVERLLATWKRALGRTGAEILVHALCQVFQVHGELPRDICRRRPRGDPHPGSVASDKHEQ
jgi:hypothetical protein